MRRTMLLLAVLGAVCLPVVGSDQADDMSFALRDDLEAVLRKAADAIYDERDDDGHRFRRATYAKKFRPVGDDRYAAPFTIDTALGDRMRTERFMYVLAKDGGSWRIVERDLRDTWERLVRDLPGNESFYRYEGMEFSAEGIVVRSGPGTAIVDELLGEPDTIRFAADDLEWSYQPPIDLGAAELAKWAIVRGRYPENLDFSPDTATLTCDAATCAGLLDSAFRGLTPATEDDLDPGLAKRYRDGLDWWNENIDDHPFTGFRRPPRADRRAWSASVRSKGDEWISLAYDSDDGREMTLRVGGMGTVFTYHDEATRAAGLPVETLERRPDSVRDYDLRSVVGTVDLATEEAELIRGDITFTLRALRDLDEVGFSLRDVSSARGSGSSEREPSLTVDRLETGDGEPLTWVRLGSAGGLIRLPEPLAEDDTLDVRVVFQNVGSLLKHSPSYTYVDRGGWLPFVTYTDAIESFDLTLRVPGRFRALGVGRLVSRERVDGMEVTRWQAEDAHFPTVIFGDYVSDRPRTSAEKFDGSEIPVEIHVDKAGMAAWEIRTKQLRPLAEQAVNALNLYREVYGVDYPYDKLDLVNDPLGSLYGQAPASIVYLGSAAFRGEGILGTVGGTGTTRFTKNLVSHEVGHQWWGSLIGNENDRNYWFVESLAEYSSALFVETLNSDQGRDPRKGHQAYLDHIADWRREVLDVAPMSSVKDARVAWSDGGYRASVYSKGPYAFHMLRVLFGDEAMFAFLRELGQELGGRTIVTSDIERVAERAFGAELTWFFDQWIRGIGIPEYRIEYETRQAEDGTWIVQGAVRQQVVMGKERARVPGLYYRALVPITVTGSDRQLYPVRLAVEGAVTEFAFKLPVKPNLVELNRSGETLALDVIDDTLGRTG